MGFDLTFKAGNTTFTHRFSMSDWDTIEALHSHLPKEVGVCFDVPELGEPAQISTAALRESALAIDRFLADNAHLVPATYQFKLERFPVPGVPAGGFDSGGVAGLRLPNDPDHFYWIQAGLNLLVLKKMKVSPDGKRMIIEERDLRGETELLTETAGRVQFRKRAAKTSLQRVLREIATFANRAVAGEVTKVVG